MEPRPSARANLLVAQEINVLGMDCQTSPYLLPRGRYQDILNSTFTPLGALTSRKGFTKYTSAAFGSYNTGTATFTKDSATVSGDGTLWQTNCKVRGLIHKVAENNWYEISAIGGETSLTLDRAYEGETAAGASYFITVERVTGMRRYYKKDGTKKFLLVAGDDLWDIPDASPHTPVKVDAGVDFGPNSPASFALFSDKGYIADGIHNLRRYDGSTLGDAGFVAPTQAPTLAEGAAGILDGRFYPCYSYVFPDGESNISPIGSPLTVHNKKLNWSNITVGPTGCIARRVYRSFAMPPLAPTAAPVLAASGTGLYGPYRTKVSLVYNCGESLCGPPSDVLNLDNEGISYTTIPLGGAGCIGRKIYRTLSGGDVFYCRYSIPDNTSTTWPAADEDTLADTSLVLAAEEPETAAVAPYLMDTIDDNETTTYTGDNKRDYDLEPVAGPTTHNVPPTGLAVIRAHQDRVFGVGVSAQKNWLYYSEHLCGDIWEKHTNSAWHIPIPSKKNEVLTALVPDSNDLLILMTSRFDLLRGVAPSDWRRTAGHQQLGTPASNGVPLVENGILIPSLIGIYAYQGDYAFPVSEPVTPLLKAARFSPRFLKYAAAIWQEHNYYFAYSDNELIKGLNSGLLLFETKHRLWGRNTGICASHFCVFDGETDNGEIFFADPRDGFIYQFGVGDTDDGTPIDWGVKTRPIAFDERAGLGVKKKGRRISAFVKATDGTLKCEYALDDGSFVEAGTATLSGGILKRYDFDLPTDTRCETITPRFSSKRKTQLIFYGYEIIGDLDERILG